MHARAVKVAGPENTPTISTAFVALGVLGWTSYQIADQLVLDRLRASASHWEAFPTTSARGQALQEFHRYAYQWY